MPINCRLKKNRSRPECRIKLKKRSLGISGRSTSDVGTAFYSGVPHRGGTRGNIVTVVKGNKVYLIGYGWAVYGTKDLRTGKTTYYSGWYGYSPTTSKHLGQSGISYKNTRVSKKRPTVDDFNIARLPAGGHRY